MGSLFERDMLIAFVRQATEWVKLNVLTLDSLTQAGLIVASFIAAKYLAKWVVRACRGLKENVLWYRRAAWIVEPLYMPIVWLALLTVMILVSESIAFADFFIRLSANLLSAWLVIRLAANLIRNPFLARIVTNAAWVVAALNIVGWLEPTTRFLDSLSFEFGTLRISIYSLIVGTLSIFIMVWIATLASSVVESRISRSDTLTPSARVLFSKIFKITVITLALVLGLASTGIDLTAFAVFSGAVGVGIGFGLQKVISNLISGVILLLDRSIKPGDVIEVGQTYGWINSLAARYTSVITRDGQEHLIPNEDIITRPVVNWTHTTSKVRQRLPVNVSYKSDIKHAMQLMLEAARDAPRVIDDPAPNCLVTGFGDNGVDLELRMWIQDPQNGVANVKSEVYLRIWDKFHEHGVEFPYPQRDIHFIDGAVKVERGGRS